MGCSLRPWLPLATQGHTSAFISDSGIISNHSRTALTGGFHYERAKKKKEPLVLWDAFVRSTLPTHPNHKEGGTFQTTYMSVRVNPADGIFQVHTKHGTLDPVLNRCMVLALNGIFLIVLVENTHSLLISSHALGSRPLALHYNFL